MAPNKPSILAKRWRSERSSAIPLELGRDPLDRGGGLAIREHGAHQQHPRMVEGEWSVHERPGVLVQTAPAAVSSDTDDAMELVAPVDLDQLPDRIPGAEQP